MTLAAILAKHRGGVVPAVPELSRPPGGAESQAGRAVPAVPLVPAQIHKGNRDTADDIRDRLLDLARAESIAPASVEALSVDDLLAYEGQATETLRACLRALDRGATMDAGQVPQGYTQVVQCRGCGPVLLCPGYADQLIACPWCFRRKAGQFIPRPEAGVSQGIAQVRAGANEFGAVDVAGVSASIARTKDLGVPR